MAFFKTSDPAQASSFVNILDEELIKMGFDLVGSDGFFKIATKNGKMFKICKDSNGHLLVSDFGEKDT